MPKKRKKDRKAPRQHGSRRTSPAQQAGPQHTPWVAGWDTVSEKNFDPLAGLASRYPTPAHGVKATQAGERVEWIGDIDGAKMRQRVVLADNGDALVEQSVFLDGALEKMLLCAAYQAGEQERDELTTGVLAALDDLHNLIRPVMEAHVREVRSEYTAAVLESFREEPEPGGTDMPVFGWRTFHDVSPETTWDDTIDTATWNSSTAMSGWLAEPDEIPELKPAPLAQLLRRHGIPVILCRDCDEPITDRHPRWNGVWVTPSNDAGPLCESPHVVEKLTQSKLGWVTDYEFGDPHHPADSARLSS